MANGNGNGNGLAGAPWQVRLVSAVGVPAAIACYLIWFLTSSVLGAINQHSAEHRAELRTLTAVIQQLCVNTAPSDEARAGCVPR